MVNFINWPIELGTAQLVTLILLANVAIDLGGCLCARKNMTPRNFSGSIEAATGAAHICHIVIRSTVYFIFIFFGLQRKSIIL